MSRVNFSPPTFQTSFLISNFSLPFGNFPNNPTFSPYKPTLYHLAHPNQSIRMIRNLVGKHQTVILHLTDIFCYQEREGPN